MSNQRSERNIGRIAQEDGGLGRMLATARALDRMDGQLRQILPENMRDHIGLACLEKRTLVLAASSPAWASRARLLASEFLLEANRLLEGGRLEAVRIIVEPALGPDPGPGNRR